MLGISNEHKLGARSQEREHCRYRAGCGGYFRSAVLFETWALMDLITSAILNQCYL